MSESTETRAEVMIATVSFDDGEVVLRLENKDRTKVEFSLHPMAGALLALTLNPALKLALEAEKRKRPEDFTEGGFPDTPEGL